MSQQGPLLHQKWPKNQKPHAQFHMIRRQSIKFQISPMKDVSVVVGTRLGGWKEGRNDGWTDAHLTNEGYFYSPPPPTSGDNYKVALFCKKIKHCYKLVQGRELIHYWWHSGIAML